MAYCETCEDFFPAWRDWKIVDVLTIEQAALLLGGDDPAKARNGRVRSSGIEAIEAALIQSVRLGCIKAVDAYTWGWEGEPLCACETGDRGLCNQSTITADELARWADGKGIEHGWPPVNTDKSTEHASALLRYPAELRAAIDAFEAVKADASAIRGKTPKAALLAWLEVNKPEIGANARERIAVVANWQPTGGAPKTPA